MESKCAEPSIITDGSYTDRSGPEAETITAWKEQLTASIARLTVDFGTLSRLSNIRVGTGNEPVFEMVLTNGFAKSESVPGVPNDNKLTVRSFGIKSITVCTKFRRLGLFKHAIERLEQCATEFETMNQRRGCCLRMSFVPHAWLFGFLIARGWRKEPDNKKAGFVGAAMYWHPSFRS